MLGRKGAPEEGPLTDYGRLGNYVLQLTNPRKIGNDKNFIVTKLDNQAKDGLFAKTNNI